MKPGDRVEVRAAWSSFHGRTGRVTELRARGPMIVLDGEDHLVPMAFGDREVMVLLPPSQPWVAGE